MAHALEMTANGKAKMVYAGATPWHGLGKSFKRPPTIEEAIVDIEADREVQLRQVSLDGELIDSYCTVRINRDGTRTLLGKGLSDSYNPLQDAAALRALAPLVDSGAATLETAGYLRDGKVLFASCKLAGFKADVVKGDPIQSYAMLTHGHDKSLAIHCGITDIRPVCQNTMRAALRKDGKSFIRLLHFKGVQFKVAEVSSFIAFERDAFTRSVERYQALARKPMSAAQFRAFARDLMASTSKKRATDRTWTPAEGVSAVDAMLDGIAPVKEGVSLNEILVETEKQKDLRSVDILCELFENGRGQTLKGVRGTSYAAFNAVTEYVTHARPNTSAESRFLASNLGDSRGTVELAMASLLDMVALPSA